MTLFEYLKKCNEVYHTTLDPRSSGVCRIHLIPPAKPRPWTPWVVIINGYSVIPLQSSWAVLLKIFIDHVNATEGRALSGEQIDDLVDDTITAARKIFKNTEKDVMKEDLGDMVSVFQDIAEGKDPQTEIGFMTLGKYAPFMKAPHRMDLMVSSMEQNGKWHCNQKCVHCYAANETLSSEKELSTQEWKKIIDACRKAGISQLTFTGGEATMRNDLAELVDYSHWFMTRLNTNGILLSGELCDKLYKASLDSVQVTLYSSNPAIHNLLVGGDHFAQTVQGIKNAVAAGLDVSINTPLCSLNKDYIATIDFAESLGVHYYSCSGLIPTGNAKNEDSAATKLSNREITDIVLKAHDHAFEKGNEVSFTSPGWISEKDLKAHYMVVPSCGACLSNMAVSPSGNVIPCQSWLSGTSLLGNMLTDPWKKIWNSPKCKQIRARSAKEEQVCLLKEGK